MNEERRLILEMIKDGSISVEEAERLLEALAAGKETEAAAMITVSQPAIMPKRIRVQATENGKSTVNVKIPFALVRAALKIGQSISSLVAKHSPSHATQFAVLNDIDIDELLRSLNDDEISLPYTFVDAEEQGKGQRVLVILE